MAYLSALTHIFECNSVRDLVVHSIQYLHSLSDVALVICSFGIHSKSTTEPQYEECGGGVISSHVAVEENPAYQSVDVAAAMP